MRINEISLKIVTGLVTGIFMAGMLYANLKENGERLGKIEFVSERHTNEIGSIREDIAEIKAGVKILLRRRNRSDD